MVAETTGDVNKLRKNSPTLATGVVGHAHFPKKMAVRSMAYLEIMSKIVHGVGLKIKSQVKKYI